MHLHSPASHPEITVATPCTGHCSTALGDDVCRSCLRTFDEITRWVGMNEEERRTVNLRIALLADRLQHQSI
jgi:hypothetical protein